MIEKLKEANKIANQIQGSDIQSFILKKSKDFDAEMLRLVADQWLAQQKAKHKLPSWFANADVIYPPILSLEQASSETTAQYKAQIFAKNFDTRTCIDLTGGMGLDSWALAKEMKSVIYIEQNELLCEVAKHNFGALKQPNIEVLNENSVLFAQSMKQTITHFYIDPHRRDSAKNKVFKIEDCEPNLLSIKHLLENYMVKFSPMLDIKLALEQLQDISEVHIVAVENDVKELLFINKKKSDIAKFHPITIYCINFLSNNQTQTFDFDYETEQNASINYSKPCKYIYEPNAAILKAGAFRSIASRLNISKLAPNSHLYTSDILIENFVGRSFICEAVCKFDKKEILSKLPQNKANISTRNFPMKPEEIKKKLGLQDGGEYYLFATENIEKQKIVLICKKA